MQDQRYDELRQMLGANAEKGIDERIKELMQNPTDPRWDDLEEEMARKPLRKELQRCYVWQSDNGEGDDADEPLAIIYVSDVPSEGETVFVCLDEREGNREYRVVHRIFGINVPHHSGCWNLYVELKRHGFID